MVKELIFITGVGVVKVDLPSIMRIAISIRNFILQHLKFSTKR